MADDIVGTAGNDTIVQAKSDTDTWRNYRGLEGDDLFQLYMGAALGGPGNDRIEKLASADWWRTVQAAYWDSPKSVAVDLAAGTADDGWGTHDTLVGVDQVGGSWQGNDHLFGNENSNYFWVGGGNGTVLVDGRGGDDFIGLPQFYDKMPLSNFDISVAIDGLSGTVRLLPGANLPTWQLNFSNVEHIGYGEDFHFVADYIKPADLANIGLLAGDANRWNAGAARGSAVEVSFSFLDSAPANGVGATGFESFSPGERAAVRSILDAAAAVAGISFKEVSSGSGQLQFAGSEQTATKGVSAMPGEPGAGAVWIDRDTLANLAPGGEGYAVLLHEIGHALGLRHPRNVEANDHYTQQMRVQDDITGNTVMSQAAAADGTFPSGWEALDVTALRTLYGSRSVNAGNTSYVLDGLRLVSETSIVDDGGNDTIDASAAKTGAAIDLVPGHLSSVGVSASGLAASFNLGIETGTWIENAVGTAFDDVIKGNTLDNMLKGGKGNDWIDGSAGTDTAVFDGARGDYLVTTGYGKVYVAARDGSGGFDTLLGIERLAFKDQSTALGPSALGADMHIDVDQNSSVSGSLPAATDATAITATYTLAKGASNGSITINANGSFTYTPVAGFASGDSFGYTLSDGKNSNSYMGYIDVRPAASKQFGGGGADSMGGTSGDDIIAAGSGNDTMHGSVGTDSIDGGSGSDTMDYVGLRGDFSFTAGSGGAVIVRKAGTDGTDTLTNMERVLFDDGAVALDTAGVAGQAYRVYVAAFARAPDPAGLGFWMHFMDSGATLAATAAGFMGSSEFQGLYGANPSSTTLITKLYQNVLHRAPDAAGLAYWDGLLKSGALTGAQVVTGFSESGENQAQVIGVIAAGMDYIPYI